MPAAAVPAGRSWTAATTRRPPAPARPAHWIAGGSRKTPRRWRNACRPELGAATRARRTHRATTRARPAPWVGALPSRITSTAKPPQHQHRQPAERHQRHTDARGFTATVAPAAAPTNARNGSRSADPPNDQRRAPPTASPRRRAPAPAPIRSSACWVASTDAACTAAATRPPGIRCRHRPVTTGLLPSTRDRRAGVLSATTTIVSESSTARAAGRRDRRHSDR